MSGEPDPGALTQQDPSPPETLERMEAILRRIPRLTREIFMAHRLDGMSYREIARRTGLSVRKVERHMARALAILDRGLRGDLRPWWRRWF